MDWSLCPDVERTPERLSGAWVVKGSRVPVEAILENAADGMSADEIAAELFPSLPADRVRRVLAFAERHETHLAR